MGFMRPILRDGIVCIGDAYGGTPRADCQPAAAARHPDPPDLSSELDRLDGLLAEGTRMVFETLSNPTLELFDIAAIAERAHAHGALLMVDNTFASPVNQQPLALGADLVVHSATKYLGGHSDITAGALMGAKVLVDAVWPWRKNLGTTPAPETAALLARSLRSLVVRVQAQNASAMAIALAMAAHPRIAGCCIRAIEGFPGHALARRQMSGFGGMLTLDIAGMVRPPRQWWIA